MQLWCESWAGWMLAEVGLTGSPWSGGGTPAPESCCCSPHLQDDERTRPFVVGAVLGDSCEQARLIFSPLVLLSVDLCSGQATYSSVPFGKMPKGK